jgi:hypothetical protein
MSSNLIQHQRTKHIEIDIHFVQENVALRQVHILHVPSSSQFADIMTKGLLAAIFDDFQSRAGSRTDGTGRGGMYNSISSIHDMCPVMYSKAYYIIDM